MAKRHKWRDGRGWKVCDDCGTRYRKGMMRREYERSDGTRTDNAGACEQRIDWPRYDENSLENEGVH